MINQLLLTLIKLSMKVFKVMAKSTNTNSFGLFQMIVVAEDGTVFQIHANELNAKEAGESILQTSDGLFTGCELCTPSGKAPQEVVDELFVPPTVRLEELRTELQAERISMGELVELQSLVKHIDTSDVELLEAAGVPE